MPRSEGPFVNLSDKDFELSSLQAQIVNTPSEGEFVKLSEKDFLPDFSPNDEQKQSHSTRQMLARLEKSSKPGTQQPKQTEQRTNTMAVATPANQGAASSFIRSNKVYVYEMPQQAAEEFTKLSAKDFDTPKEVFTPVLSIRDFI